MARARSPDSIRAEEMYRNGAKLVDIAREIGVPDATVRRWKSTQKWDKNKPNSKSERSDKKKASVRKRGAPKGSKNALGNCGGGPYGNQHATKHGAYSKVYWDVLDDEEKDLIEDMPKDEETLLLEQIQLFSVRERRIMKAINKYREQPGEVALLGVTRTENKRAFKTDEEKEEYERRVSEKVNSGDRMPGDMYTLSTQTENKDNLITRLEKELSTVQSKKTRALEALARLRLEKQKLAGETKGNEVVRAWADAVIKARGEADG